MVTPSGASVLAEVSPAGDPDAAKAGEVWLTFPVQTGVGEGTGALWWSPAAGLARLPLGSRSGELELVLSVKREDFDGSGGDGAPAPSSASRVAAEAALASVQREREAWDAGAFVLQDGSGNDVGAVQMLGAEHPAQVGVWDALWLTDGMVAADRGDDGGDLLLAFTAEPNVQGEDALLRLNVVTRRVVVPSGRHPSPDDRWLVAVPGTLEAAQVEAGMGAAIEAADRQELAWLNEVAKRLTADASSQGECVVPAEAQAAWELLLTGYEVSVGTLGNSCAVRLEAQPTQHRRRFSGWVGPDGVLDPAEWPSD